MNITHLLTSNTVIKETVEINLNYSPLVFVNLCFSLLLFTNVVFEYAEKRFNIENYWYNVTCTIIMLVVNVFYFFTHFFPTLGFYY